MKTKICTSMYWKKQTIFLLGICVLPIGALIIFTVIKTIINAKKSFSKQENEEVSLEQRLVFQEAYGGENNIKNVNIEMSRIIVDVEDIALVSGEKLQELGASGVLLVGNTVKCSFGDRAKNVYNIIK